jgi:hypothetical protein
LNLWYGNLAERNLRVKLRALKLDQIASTFAAQIVPHSTEPGPDVAPNAFSPE